MNQSVGGFVKARRAARAFKAHQYPWWSMLVSTFELASVVWTTKSMPTFGEIKSVSLVLQIPCEKVFRYPKPTPKRHAEGGSEHKGCKKKIASNIRVLSISIPCVSRIILRLESSGYVEHLDLSISWTISVAGMASWFLFRFKHVQTEHPIHDGKQSTCF